MPINEFNSEAVRGLLLDVKAVQELFNVVTEFEELRASMARQKLEIEALRSLYSEMLMLFGDLKKEIKNI